MHYILRMKDKNNTFRESHVRVLVDGRYQWVHRDLAVRVLRTDGRGWRWRLLADLPDPVGLR